MELLKKLSLAAILVLLVQLAASPYETSAQTSLNVEISTVRTTSFPEIVLYASASDQNGSRISGLTEEDFTILENGTGLAPVSVQEERLGTRQIYFINTSLAIALRDAAGNTRLDYAREALLNWWQLPDAARVNLDDLSLYTSEATLAVHETSAAVLASRLAAFSSDFELETFPYQRMLEVLRAANDPLPREGMPTSMIFVSPLVRTPELEDLDSVITAARNSGVTVHTVLLAEGDDVEGPIATEMERLSTETGGSLVVLDPETGLDNLAERVISEQSQYILRYQSRINTSGEHTLALEASAGAAAGTSSAVSFSLEVQPPVITFESIPDSVTRRSEDPALPLEKVAPVSQEVAVSVAFPDGYPRDLTSTALLVNGEEVSVNTSPPFERFDLDISSYTADTELRVTARVEDSLGIAAESSEHTLRITMDLPPTGLAALRPALNSFFFTVAGILLAVAVLAGVVMFIRKAAARPSLQAEQQLEPGHNGLPAVSSRPVRQSSDEIPEASLVSLDSESLSVPLIGVDHIIGKDAALATIILQDPSVDALHARLIRHADGKYLLKDTGSTAGTWVNYHQIPESGMILQHGDLIHFGRSGFRYTRRLAARIRQPVVTDLFRPAPNGQEQRLEEPYDPNK